MGRAQIRLKGGGGGGKMVKLAEGSRARAVGPEKFTASAPTQEGEEVTSSWQWLLPREVGRKETPAGQNWPGGWAWNPGARRGVWGGSRLRACTLSSSGLGDSGLTLALGSNFRGVFPPSLRRNLLFLCSLPTGTVLELGKFHLPVGEPVELGEANPVKTWFSLLSAFVQYSVRCSSK